MSEEFFFSVFQADPTKDEMLIDKFQGNGTRAAFSHFVNKKISCSISKRRGIKGQKAAKKLTFVNILISETPSICSRRKLSLFLLQIQLFWQLPITIALPDCLLHIEFY